jgi:ribonuclease HII
MSVTKLEILPNVAGADEAGRGPLAGPVVAAAVLLSEGFDVRGIRDSKQLTRDQREAAFARIVTTCAFEIEMADVEEIDRKNILRASLAAMARALERLSPERALIDGNQLPPSDLPMETVVKGDAKFACIAAASILAKVTRDRLMVAYDAEYPGYGFASNYGYPTPDHLEALRRLGPCPIHRRSFAPVQAALLQPTLWEQS